MPQASRPPVWTPMKLDIFLQNLKYTLRTLSRDRGFTLVAVLILALAIGANIGVFSVVNTLLLRPLPFPESHQLAWIAPPPAGCGLSCATYSADAYEAVDRCFYPLGNGNRANMSALTSQILDQPNDLPEAENPRNVRSLP
jgi:hypothetical protein